LTEIINLKDVSKVYRTAKVTAVADINLSINQGEFFCMVGPSGCGKSTILRLISGLEQASIGKVAAPQEVSMVFQSGALLPWMTVEENVSLVNKVKKISQAKIEEQTLKCLRLVDLETFRFRYPRELSGGQRQRVGIARALAIEPKILLLDEPFSALDPVTTDDLHQYILKIWQETKATIVMVSHSIEEAVFLSDRIAIMTNGKIQEILEVNLKRPRNEETKDFLGLVDKIKKTLES